MSDLDLDLDLELSFGLEDSPVEDSSLDLDMEDFSEDEIGELVFGESEILLEEPNLDIKASEQEDEKLKMITSLHKQRLRAEGDKLNSIKEVVEYYLTKMLSSHVGSEPVRGRKNVQKNVENSLWYDPIAGNEGMAEELLEQAPTTFPDSLKSRLVSISSYIVTQIYGGYPSAEIREKSLFTIKNDINEYNKRLAHNPGAQVVLDTNLNNYLGRFVDSKIAKIRGDLNLKKMQENRVKEESEKFTLEMENTKSHLKYVVAKLQKKDLTILDEVEFISEINIGNGVQVECNFCETTQERESFADLFLYKHSTAPDMFVPILKCPGCGRFLVLTKGELNLLEKYLVSRYKKVESVDGYKRPLTLYRPNPEVYETVLPHVSNIITETGYEADNSFDLDLLTKHVEEWRDRVKIYESFTNTSSDVSGNSTQEPVRMKSLAKYLATVYGEEYSRLKSEAIGTILRGFTKDPVLKYLEISSDKILRESFEKAKNMAGEYDLDKADQYYWFYRRISEISSVPFHTVVTGDGILDKEKFESFVETLRNIKPKTVNLEDRVERFARSFTFRKIEKEPLSNLAWQSVLNNKKYMDMLDTAADLMVINHLSAAFFEDYDSKNVYSKHGSILKRKGANGNLKTVLLAEDDNIRLRRLNLFLSKLRAASAEECAADEQSPWARLRAINFSAVLPTFTLSWYKSNEDLKLVQALFYGLQTSDDWLINKAMAAVSYIVHKKKFVIPTTLAGNKTSIEVEGIPVKIADGLRDLISPDIAEDISYKELIQEYFLHHFSDKFSQPEILDALPDRIRRIDPTVLDGLNEVNLVQAEETAVKLTEEKGIDVLDKYIDLYLEVYGFVTYFYGPLHDDGDELVKYLMFDIFEFASHTGDTFFEICEIDKDIFNLLSRKAKDVDLSDQSPEMQLQMILTESVPLETAAQDLAKRAVISGVSGTTQKQSVNDVEDITEVPVNFEDIQELLDNKEEFSCSDRIPELVDQIWGEEVVSDGSVVAGT